MLFPGIPKISRISIAASVLTCCAPFAGLNWIAAADLPNPRAASLSATYHLDGREVTLNNGKAVVETFPESASQTVVQVSGSPVVGHLNEDALPDAALVLVQTTGGSGSFFFVASAINHGNRVEGSNAIFLGDRIKPQLLAIDHRLVIVDYLDRPRQTPMAVPPDQTQSLYLHLDGNNLQPISMNEDELLIAGNLVIDQEGQTLHPCGQPTYRLASSSPGLSDLKQAYQTAVTDAPANAPLFVIVAGELSRSPEEGPGAMAAEAISVNRLIKVLPGHRCLESSD
ncbi:MAG: hypothetical protein JRF07_08265 [Deltaproteobacteria bacterium]|jgi:hypothetical protein|nr:hypothetical protein [Deltaproteobacteria bacterium]